MSEIRVESKRENLIKSFGLNGETIIVVLVLIPMKTDKKIKLMNLYSLIDQYA